MTVAVVTGSGGLVGAAASRLFAERGFSVVGIDNDMRRSLFGHEAETSWQIDVLKRTLPRYQHMDDDIRDVEAMRRIFRHYGSAIRVVIHCAAQPSHDWAVRDPDVDFTINANGTQILLEATRRHASDAAFIFVSTNKVYGDRPNQLPLTELATRYELTAQHDWNAHGIPEEMGVDQTLHSLFGASKLAADILVQEYGRYFGMNTACFRGGCLTGPGHSGAQLHGFLAYLMKCAVTDKPYTVFGYNGKQVRDNIHATDLVEAFWCFAQRPEPASVFNIGGGRHANCSMLEAIAMTEQLTGRPMRWSYNAENRIGDHMWWISDVRKFRALYPEWDYRYNIRDILADLHNGVTARVSL
jgi:CDP-paratose 2-epimerase